MSNAINRAQRPTSPRRGSITTRRASRAHRSTIDDLRSVVVLTQLTLTLTLATLLALTPPALLLLTEELRSSTGQFLLAVALAAGTVGSGLSFLDMRRLQYLVKALRDDSEIIAPGDVRALGRQARRCTALWLAPHIVLLLLFLTPARPPLMDLTTGVSLTLLCCAIVATVALALYATLRATFLKVMELVPTRAMKEVLLSRKGLRESRHNISRRLVIAVVMPMLFVAVGCALIANAHVRRADERHREQSARLMALTAFGPEGAGTDEVGLSELYAQATKIGFSTNIIERKQEQSIRRLKGGLLEVTEPLPSSGTGRSAQVRFNGSGVPVLSLKSLLTALLAVLVAAAFGLNLGNALTQDLFEATAGIRLLGTRPVLSQEKQVARLPRFQIVRQLQEAITGVSDRFRIFAQAQQDAISARASTTRMRGQFFASVSHELRSPLNSILGFTELVRMETLSEGQAESLQVISDRGQELLTLIETILDAARIEVGQLSLMFDEVPFRDLFEEALEKAAQLAGDRRLQVFEEIENDLPKVVMDRTRGARAIATFIAYSVRATDGAKMWVRAERHGANNIRIDVDVPSRLHTADELSQMLEPKGGLAKREHRGLALGLQLANSVVKLHGGTVNVVNRRHKGSMFCITLPSAKPMVQSTPPQSSFSERPPHAPNQTDSAVSDANSNPPVDETPDEPPDTDRDPQPTVPKRSSP